MHAARQLSPGATTPEPVISSLGGTTTEPTGQGACALQREKPTQLIWRTAPAHHNLRKPSHSNKEQAQPKKEIQTRLEYGFGGGGVWLHCIFTDAHRLSFVAAGGGYSSFWCTGFSLQWLLLFQSTGCRHTGLRSCSVQALECAALGSCGPWA